jgi:4-methyl-5(b-hydroxyethyl)-thiazole monophosphate biosynthesis
MKNICVFLAPGFEEIEAISIIDVLRRASLPVLTVSISGLKEVTGSHQITVVADVLFEETVFSETEMLVLPGGMPGAKNLATHSGLNKLISEFHKKEKPLGAICAAPLVFGGLGILQGKDATCFPGFENYLTGANILDRTVVQDGNIVTGIGAGVAIRFALKIVEMLKGKEVADQLSEKMIVE